jgi:hypothetical protein
MERKFKMLLNVSDGRVFPYTDLIANTKGLVPVEMTKEEILGAIKRPHRKEKTESADTGEEINETPAPVENKKPGKGYVLNNKGKWTKPKK